MDWIDVQYDYPFAYADDYFIDQSALDAKNYCRSFYDEEDPWCFVGESSETCDIPKC